MEFFVNDPKVQRLPPSEVRLLSFHADRDPDGKKLRISMKLTPFQKRPYIDLVLTDSNGVEASSASIVEPVGWKLELVMHIRQTDSASRKYSLKASVSYPELGEVDRRSLDIEAEIPV